MKKIISAILVIIMLSLLLVGCGGVQGTMEEGVLVMATNADFPPFEFINDDGDYDGFDIHLARAIADILDKELVIRDMDFDLVLAALGTGQADVAIAAITINEERARQVYFTNPYFETNLVVIVMEDSNITSVADLEGATIAVQLGTTSDLWVDLNGRSLGIADVTQLQSPPDTVLELTTGRADAIIIDEEVANQFISDNPNLRLLEESLGQESYGMAVRRGNSQLRDDINDAIQQLKDNGEYNRIFNMFFGG